MRLAIVVLVMMLCAIARAQIAHAQDDEGLLDTAPLEGIPERMDVLEQEWHEEAGTKDPVDDTEKATDEGDDKDEGLAAPAAVEKDAGLAPEMEKDEEEAPTRREDAPEPAKSDAPTRPVRALPQPAEKPRGDVSTDGKPPVPDPRMAEE